MWIMLNSSLVVGCIVEEPCDAGVSAFVDRGEKKRRLCGDYATKQKKDNKSQIITMYESQIHTKNPAPDKPEAGL